jgi:cytochrome c oxidase assembly factor CtaG
LGALITFSPRPWYAAHLDTTAAWGLTPLADQQLAGAIMWVPAGVVYVAAALALFGGWLAAVERRARESEG